MPSLNFAHRPWGKISWPASPRGACPRSILPTALEVNFLGLFHRHVVERTFHRDIHGNPARHRVGRIGGTEFSGALERIARQADVETAFVAQGAGDGLTA